MFSKKNCILDMERREMISYSVVILDNVYSDIKFENKQTMQVNNPFVLIANSLFLKSMLNSNVIEDLDKSHKIHKEFISEDIRINWDFFPPKIEIKQITELNESNVIPIAKKIISFANLENSIGRIGINYEMFIEDSVNLKDYLLKDKVAKGFSSLSATPVFKIDKETVLNLTIASATNKSGKRGIYLQANFDNKISEENSLEKIFNKVLKEDFIKTTEEKINLIFKK